jgi:hypothetical protein
MPPFHIGAAKEITVGGNESAGDLSALFPRRPLGGVTFLTSKS